MDDLVQRCLTMVGYCHSQMVENHMAQNFCFPPSSSSSTTTTSSQSVPECSKIDFDFNSEFFQNGHNISLSARDDPQYIIIGKFEHWQPHQVAKLQPKIDHRHRNDEQRQYRKKQCPTRNHLLSKYSVKHQKHQPIQQPQSRQIRFYSKKFGGRA